MIDALRESGVRVPDDVAVVGFDNWDVIAAATRPPVTTIDMNLRELGRQAHSLKHSTSSFGLIDLAATAAGVEKAADAQQGAEAAAELALLEKEADGELAALQQLLKTL